MNREHAKELLPILQAFVNGKVIQRKYGTKWICDDDEIKLDQELRIKPEPREFWLHFTSDGILAGAVSGSFRPAVDGKAGKYIKVREVIDES